MLVFIYLLRDHDSLVVFFDGFAHAKCCKYPVHGHAFTPDASATTSIASRCGVSRIWYVFSSCTHACRFNVALVTHSCAMSLSPGQVASILSLPTCVVIKPFLTLSIFHPPCCRHPPPLSGRFYACVFGLCDRPSTLITNDRQLRSQIDRDINRNINR